MNRRVRRGRKMIMTGVLVAAAAVGGGLPAPAPAQAPPLGPEVAFVEGFVSSPFAYRDCDGVVHESAVDASGFFYVELDDAVLVDTDLTVTFTGSLADDLVETPATLTVPGGDSYGEVEIAFDEAEPGDLTMTVEPGVGYVADPAEDTFTIVVEDLEPDIVVDCFEDLGTPPDRTDRQTIRVGERPDPLGLFGDDFEGEEGDYPFGAFGTDVGLTQVVNGALPPGLTYDDDIWGGAATTVGTYAFDVRLCLDTTQFEEGENPDGFPPIVCLGYVDVEIVVEAAAATAPGTAGPATPVTARARFTG